MRLALSFALLGFVLIAVAIDNGDYRYLAAWMGIDFVVIAFAYFRIGASVFGKKSNGRLSLWSKVLFAPYLAYAATIWHASQLLSPEARANSITDEIVVVRRLPSSEMDHHFDSIVDLTAKFEEPSGIRNHPGYHCFPILDASAPTSEALHRMIRALPSGSVYIHCAQGHGRTGLFAAALLLHRHIAASIDEGLSILKKARPGITLSSAQFNRLRAYESRFAEALSGGSGE